MNIKKLSKTAKEKKEFSPHGVSCNFVPINDKWGMKIYKTETERNKAFVNQKEFLEHSLAPEIGGKVDLPDIGFAYITEIVETVLDQHEYLEHDDHDRSQYWDAEEKWSHKNLDEILELMNKINSKSTSFRFYDNHAGNLGRKNGKLIPIDFD